MRVKHDVPLSAAECRRHICHCKMDGVKNWRHQKCDQIIFLQQQPQRHREREVRYLHSRQCTSPIDSWPTDRTLDPKILLEPKDQRVSLSAPIDLTCRRTIRNTIYIMIFFDIFDIFLIFSNSDLTCRRTTRIARYI